MQCNRGRTKLKMKIPFSQFIDRITGSSCFACQSFRIFNEKYCCCYIALASSTIMYWQQEIPVSAGA